MVDEGQEDCWMTWRRCSSGTALLRASCQLVATTFSWLVGVRNVLSSGKQPRFTIAYAIRVLQLRTCSFLELLHPPFGAQSIVLGRATKSPHRGPGCPCRTKYSLILLRQPCRLSFHCRLGTFRLHARLPKADPVQENIPPRPSQGKKRMLEQTSIMYCGAT